jgi:uncharacterized membrane protein
MATTTKPFLDVNRPKGEGQSAEAQPFTIRKLVPDDLLQALKLGFLDFKAKPSHLIFLAAIYPVGAFMLAQLTVGYDLLPLFFPLLAGFAILGPFAAIGLYEISRRREMGSEPSWRDALEVWHAPGRSGILALGLLLCLIFAVWMVTADWLYGRIMGGQTPASISGFLTDVMTTRAGWSLIVFGHAAGLVFAALAFAMSVISFPLLIDRPVGAIEAIRASVMTVRTNPMTMALWAAIIAVGLMAGSALLFVGLVIVLPVLAHASWHLYRRAVVWA